MAGKTTVLTCSVELNIQSITCCVNPPKKEDVYLVISMFGEFFRTKSMKPIFPLIVKEKFKFKKVFSKSCDLIHAAQILLELTVTIKLMQTRPLSSDPCISDVLLACHESNVHSFLYPSTGTQCQRSLYLDRTCAFQIDPLLKFSTSTVLHETSTETNHSPARSCRVGLKEKERKSRSRSASALGNPCNRSTACLPSNKSTYKQETKNSCDFQCISGKPANSMCDQCKKAISCKVCKSSSKKLDNCCGNKNVKQSENGVDLLEGKLSRRPKFVIRKVDSSLIKRNPGFTPDNLTPLSCGCGARSQSAPPNKTAPCQVLPAMCSITTSEEELDDRCSDSRDDDVDHCAVCRAYRKYMGKPYPGHIHQQDSSCSDDEPSDECQYFGHSNIFRDSSDFDEDRERDDKCVQTTDIFADL